VELFCIETYCFYKFNWPIASELNRRCAVGAVGNGNRGNNWKTFLIIVGVRAVLYGKIQSKLLKQNKIHQIRC